ncbi:MAG: GHMP kinase [Anaerolineales bacterium]|nr:GHMP kinase [Anaerolineales bacterium]
MIIVQSPLRISFLGGGTDFADYYLQEGGAVLSTSIDKYIFVTIKRRFDALFRIGYTTTETAEVVDDIKHELIREALRMTGVQPGVEITTMGDIPSAGSGLGSSSTVTVGSLHAMYALQGDLPTADQLARGACQIEIGTLGKPIGVQDQYAAAFGGLRFYEFSTDGSVVSERVEIDRNTLLHLNESLLLFFTGLTRKAEGVLNEQRQNIQSRLGELNEIKAMAYTARDELRKGNIEALGDLLDRNWTLKKRLASNVSNPEIDAMYAAARGAGALGGKITGAGGGGFLLLFCPPDRRAAVRQALGGKQELPFALEPNGSKVIFDYRR